MYIDLTTALDLRQKIVGHSAAVAENVFVNWNITSMIVFSTFVLVLGDWM